MKKLLCVTLLSTLGFAQEKHTYSEPSDEIFIGGTTGSVIAFAHNFSNMLPKESEEIFLANNEEYDKVKTQTGHSSQHTVAYSEQSRKQKLVLEIIWALARFTAIIAIIYLVFSYVVKRIEEKNKKQRRERRRQRGELTGQSIEMQESRGSEASEPPRSRTSSALKSDRLV